MLTQLRRKQDNVIQSKIALPEGYDMKVVVFVVATPDEVVNTFYEEK